MKKILFFSDACSFPVSIGFFAGYGGGGFVGGGRVLFFGVAVLFLGAGVFSGRVSVVVVGGERVLFCGSTVLLWGVLDGIAFVSGIWSFFGGDIPLLRCRSLFPHFPR